MKTKSTTVNIKIQPKTGMLCPAEAFSQTSQESFAVKPVGPMKVNSERLWEPPSELAMRRFSSPMTIRHPAPRTAASVARDGLIMSGHTLKRPALGNHTFTTRQKKIRFC